MMVSTHLLSGALVGLLLAHVAPALLLPLVAAGLVGAAFPDLDMFWEHRKTLHRPVQFGVAAAAALLLYAVSPMPVLLGVAALSGAAAVHAASEIFSQGKTAHPDRYESDRAIYDRVNGRWIPPRNLIIVASRRDLLLTYLLAVPLLLTPHAAIRGTGASLAVLGTLNAVFAARVRQRIAGDSRRSSEAIQQRIGPETHDG